MHKQLYDAAKQKVIDLVHAAKTSFYSAIVSCSATCKELFHNMTTLWDKNKSSSSLPSVYDLQLARTFSYFFLKQNHLHSKQLFVCGTEEKRLSARIFWHPISLLYTSFWTICLKRLSFRLSPRLPCLIRFQLNFSTKPLKSFSRQSPTFSMNHSHEALFPLNSKQQS